ncbi:MAG: DUF3500 domain-containing protein [Gammaproteobacteria bacterium]
MTRKPARGASGSWMCRLFTMVSILITTGLLSGAATATEKEVVGIEFEERAAINRMRVAMLAFLDGLTPELRDKAMFDFRDEERQRWSNVPYTMYEREGVSIGEMTADQQVLAHRLLQSALTDQGYLKTTGIMHLDEILAAMARARGRNDSPFGLDYYWIGVFGDPANDGVWGWQLDGHHLALNFTVVGDHASVTPAFMGTDPAEIRDGPHAGWRILSEEDDVGRALFESLDEAQKKKALLSSDGLRDIIAGAGNRDRITAIEGLPARDMNTEQQTLLSLLILTYLDNMRPGLIVGEKSQLPIEGLHFAWMGAEAGKPYYYRIHGPNIWIEFDNSYAPGRKSGPINHIHSIWRHPANDYGLDLLREHYETSPHHQEPGDE